MMHTLNLKQIQLVVVNRMFENVDDNVWTVDNDANKNINACNIYFSLV